MLNFKRIKKQNEKKRDETFYGQRKNHKMTMVIIELYVIMISHV